MIIATCPLRVSLVGGSTDNPNFIDKYNYGSVINFASNLNVYAATHQDYFGMNTIEHKYSINYSRKETVSNVGDIQNELIRYTFEYLNVETINCSLTSDIFSVGSGLAASSSYIMALIKAIYSLRGKFISTTELATIAEEIEKKFNPLVGKQDFYGGCVGGLKKIDFEKEKTPSITFLNEAIFEELNMYLYYTGITRNSTKILESVDIDKSLSLLNDVKQLYIAINNSDVSMFNEIINQAWKKKKETSKNIWNIPGIITIDKTLTDDKDVLSHKLCGAGGGGYFLMFSSKNVDLTKRYPMSRIIKISETGVNSIKINELNRI